MRAEAIREWQRAQPFVPFRLCLSDGQRHEVRHPELVTVTARAVFLAIPPEDDDDIPDQYKWLDPVHITQIEPFRRRGAQRSRGNGSG